jgi:hypothetical protein
MITWHPVLTTRELALCGAFGSLLAGIGSMYWAYEILGGQSGPMNLLTRTVSYSLMYIAAYCIFFNVWFGIIAGTGLGIALSLEHMRIARYQRRYGSSPLQHLPSLGAARGGVLTLAAIHPYGLKFALAWGGLTSIGLYAVYANGFAPTFDYRAHTRPVLAKHRMMASVWRGVAVGTAGVLAGVWIQPGWHSLLFGIYVGFAAGLVSFVVGTLSPFIEYWADALPERRLAAIGVAVMLFGMLLQTIQYLIVLGHIPVR